MSHQREWKEVGGASGLSSGQKLGWEVDSFSFSLSSEQTTLQVSQKQMVFLRLGEVILGLA